MTYLAYGEVQKTRFRYRTEYLRRYYQNRSRLYKKETDARNYLNTEGHHPTYSIQYFSKWLWSLKEIYMITRVQTT